MPTETVNVVSQEKRKLHSAHSVPHLHHHSKSLLLPSSTPPPVSQVLPRLHMSLVSDSWERGPQATKSPRSLPFPHPPRHIHKVWMYYRLFRRPTSFRTRWGRP